MIGIYWVPLYFHEDSLLVNNFPSMRNLVTCGISIWNYPTILIRFHCWDMSLSSPEKQREGPSSIYVFSWLIFYITLPSINKIRKKWPNLKPSTKMYKLDSSFREARKTGGSSNQARVVENEEMMIISADRCLSNYDESAGKSIWQQPNLHVRHSIPFYRAKTPPPHNDLKFVYYIYYYML